MPRMNREEFINTFANETHYQKELDGETMATIHVGSSKGLDEIEIQDYLPRGYEVAWGWSQEPYRIVFVDLEGHSIISYCEGDIDTTTHDGQAEFTAELLKARRFYGAARKLDSDYDESEPGNYKDPEGLLISRGEPDDEKAPA